MNLLTDLLKEDYVNFESKINLRLNSIKELFIQEKLEDIGKEYFTEKKDNKKKLINDEETTDQKASEMAGKYKEA